MLWGHSSCGCHAWKVLWAQQPGDGASPQPPCGQGSGTRQEGGLAVLALPCVMLGWMTSSAVEIKDSTCAVGSSSEFCPATHLS